MRKVELLSPAKNLEIGLAAINHGADAVYIGASQFGARAAAGNSIEDIEKLAKYAHQYHSKVFVALNTLLTDQELPKAEKLIHHVYEAGADALIVQDMGVLKMDLPPIQLHASTQTDNRTVEKVEFLQNVGFSRVVLARELSLNQISDIYSKTNVELEAFIHGALCVSYSGQCYMSEAMVGRSANRGQCAQYCRLPYDLQDADGNIIVRNKHLLSLKDLDLSEYLEEMMDAGVMSFKIEGRLKEADYVKNITSYYRKKLDTILEGKTEFRKTSSGKTTFFFDPNPEKSFRRSSTDYFLHDRHTGIIQPETPKSIGEPLGQVSFTAKNFFEMQNGTLLNNGDGLCFINEKGELTGFRVNRVEGKQIFPAVMPSISNGTFLYRNQDQAFEKILSGKTAERKIGVSVVFYETSDGFSVRLTDEDGIQSASEFESEKQVANKPDAVEPNITNQFYKTGNTIYYTNQIVIELSSPWFIPASKLSDWRRQAFEQLDIAREKAYKREEPSQKLKADFPLKSLSYLGNVTNHLSKAFYHEHGVKSIQPGFEVRAVEGVPLMFTKHCIKNEMGWCPKAGVQSNLHEPLYLKHGGQQFELHFDCKNCEMQIIPYQK